MDLGKNASLLIEKFYTEFSSFVLDIVVYHLSI